ncbi:MAG: acyl-CoA carboxylase biotin carboxyl carrier protein subunit [Thermoanaerobaculia bacterium]
MSEQTVNIAGEEFELALEKKDGVWNVRGAGRDDAIEVISIGDSIVELRVNGRQVIIPYSLAGEKVQFVFDGETRNATVAPKGAQARKRRAKEHSMSAPMPGVVLKVFVAVGDVVRHGKPLLVLEAMKMEHQITAPYDGVVRALHCKEGEMVQPGIDLISFEAQESE